MGGPGSLRPIHRTRVDVVVFAAALGRSPGGQQRLRSLGELSVPLDALKAFRQLTAAVRDIPSTAGRRAWKQQLVL